MSDTVGRIVQLPNGTAPSKSVQRRLTIQVNAQIERERDELHEKLKRAEEGLTEGSTRPHSALADCPTWYNLCNCNVDALIHNIERAEKAEAALRELIKAADPETNMSMIPLLDALAHARRAVE